MRQINRPDVTLHFEDTGGEGPCVIFLHGAGGNHLSWWQQIPHFSKRYRCLTVDQRGFGRAVINDPSKARTTDELGADVLAILDELAVDKAAIVSQSMGGWAAVSAAGRARERFWAIALTNTVGHLGNARINELRKSVLANLMPVGQDFAARGAAAGGAPPLHYARQSLAQVFLERSPEFGFLYSEIAGLNPPPTGTGVLEQSFTETYDVAMYASLEIPTLFLTGSEDRVIWASLSKLVHQHVPESEYIEFPDVGHAAYFEHPGAFNVEVGRFLDLHVPV